VSDVFRYLIKAILSSGYPSTENGEGKQRKRPVSPHPHGMRWIEEGGSGERVAGLRGDASLVCGISMKSAYRKLWMAGAFCAFPRVRCTWALRG